MLRDWVRILALASLLFLFVGGCSENKEQALDLARKWARLAPYPPTTKLEVFIEGGAASREFIVELEASKVDIDQWLEKSPGIQDAETEEIKGGTRYKIKPDKAQFAELERYSDTKVKLRTYWS